MKYIRDYVQQVLADGKYFFSKYVYLICLRRKKLSQRYALASLFLALYFFMSFLFAINLNTYSQKHSIFAPNSIVIELSHYFL